MPGAKILPGLCRSIIPVPVPEQAPPLTAKAQKNGIVQLAWPRSAKTIGLSFDLYRHTEPGFKPRPELLVNRTTMFKHEDFKAPRGRQYYALVASSGGTKCKPTYAAVNGP